jgi:RNA polymerase sigma factor (sigma-70 family)
MDHGSRPQLVDENGQPFEAHIEQALSKLSPRFARQYPSIHDDVTRTELLEEAGRRIALRERRHGPLERLHGYAWVTLRSVATSWLRRGSSRLAGRTLPPEEGEATLLRLPSQVDSAILLERRILLREALSKLSEDERMVCVWKKAGFSSREIAAERGGTAAAVDTVFSRAKHKIRVALGVQQEATMPATTTQNGIAEELGSEPKENHGHSKAAS